MQRNKLQFMMDFNPGVISMALGFTKPTKQQKGNVIKIKRGNDNKENSSRPRTEKDVFEKCNFNF